jgi:hypothetical protein
MLVLAIVTALAPSSLLFADGRAGQDESLMKAFREHQHRVRPQGAGFRLQNPENDFSAEFHDGAVTANHPAGRFALRLEACGYGDHPPAPTRATMQSSGTRIEYRRGPLT